MTDDDGVFRKFKSTLIRLFSSGKPYRFIPDASSHWMDVNTGMIQD